MILPYESFDVDVEKLQRIIKEVFGRRAERIIPYVDDGKHLIDIVFDDWVGMHLSDLNRFADRLCRERIMKSASKDFFIFDTLSPLSARSLLKEKNCGSLGIMIDVSDRWFRSLRPKPKTRIAIKPKPQFAAILVDEGELGINKEERKRQIIMERQLQREG